MDAVKPYPSDRPIDQPTLKYLGCVDYLETLDAMHTFVAEASHETPDEIWVVQHPPTFSLGQANRRRSDFLSAPRYEPLSEQSTLIEQSNLRQPNNPLRTKVGLLGQVPFPSSPNGEDQPAIPVIQSDRGGLTTYHAPGQVILYYLIDLQRRGWYAKTLVSHIEQTTCAFLEQYGIAARTRADAPGVYTESGQKIASLGLRVRRHRSFHGLALNVDMDLNPYTLINPCGLSGMKMTQMRHYLTPCCYAEIERAFAAFMCSAFAINGSRAEPEPPLNNSVA